MDFAAKLKDVLIVPVVVMESADHAEPLADALLEGGLPCAEVTFRTDAAAESIRRMSRRPEILLGAGTVTNADQVDRAVDAGASFIVSPGLSEAVVERAQKLGVPVTPGVATPTEIMRAMDLGLDILKFFPAESLGGLETLKAVAAPFSRIRFVPTGGITSANLGKYLAFPKVLACGGSWMVKADLMKTGRFDEISRLTREAVALAKETRPKG